MKTHGYNAVYSARRSKLRKPIHCLSPKGYNMASLTLKSSLLSQNVVFEFIMSKKSTRGVKRHHKPDFATSVLQPIKSEITLAISEVGSG